MEEDESGWYDSSCTQPSHKSIARIISRCHWTCRVVGILKVMISPQVAKKRNAFFMLSSYPSCQSGHNVGGKNFHLEEYFTTRLETMDPANCPYT